MPLSKEELALCAAAQCGAIKIALHAVSNRDEKCVRSLFGPEQAQKAAAAREALEAFFNSMKGFT